MAKAKQYCSSGDAAFGYSYNASFTKGYHPKLKTDNPDFPADFSKWEARIIQFETDDKFWNELVDFSDGGIENSIGCKNGQYWTQVKLFDNTLGEGFRTYLAFEGDVLLKRRYGSKKDRIYLIRREEIKRIMFTYVEDEESWVGVIQTWGMLGRLKKCKELKDIKNWPAPYVMMSSYCDSETLYSDMSHEPPMEDKEINDK